MARGKQTCKILKEIRRQIAEANDIEFVTSECLYKGDCLGTCPKCEAEVRYLEQQLRSRQFMGKAVVLAGVSVGIIALSGCGISVKQPTDDSEASQDEPIEMIEEDIDMIDVEDGETPLLEDSIILKQGEVEETLITVGEIIDPKNPENKPSYIDTPPSFPGGDTNVWWMSKHLPEANSQTFKPIEVSSYRYGKKDPMSSGDFNYGKDNRHVFYQDSIIVDADPESFEKIDFPDGDSWTVFDKNRVYQGKDSPERREYLKKKYVSKD